MALDICMYAILRLNVSWPQKTGKVTYVVNNFNHFLSIYKNFNVNFLRIYTFSSLSFQTINFEKFIIPITVLYEDIEENFFSEYVFISEKCFPIKLMAFNCHFHSLQNKWAFNTRDTIKMIDVNLQKSLKKEKKQCHFFYIFYCFSTTKRYLEFFWNYWFQNYIWIIHS